MTTVKITTTTTISKTIIRTTKMREALTLLSCKPNQEKDKMNKKYFQSTFFKRVAVFLVVFIDSKVWRKKKKNPKRSYLQNSLKKQQQQIKKKKKETQKNISDFCSLLPLTCNSENGFEKPPQLSPCLGHNATVIGRV